MRKNFAITLIVIGIILFVLGAFFIKEPEVTPEPAVTNDEPTPQPNPVLVPQPDLPPAVAAKREAIFNATLSRDYDTLAAEAGDMFYYSFGGPVEGGFAAYLRLYDGDNKEPVFDVIQKILNLPFAKQFDTYTWPTVHLKTAADWNEGDLAQMRVLLTEEEIENYRQFGSYAYYRMGINENGEWTYYIAGD